MANANVKTVFISNIIIGILVSMGQIFYDNMHYIQARFNYN